MSTADFSLKVIKPSIGDRRVSGGKENLTSSFDLVEEARFLFVKVVKARDLAHNGHQPFVEIKIGNYKGITKANHEWNQVFAFTKDRIHSLSVEIVVRDKESVNNELVGKIAISIGDIPTRVPPDSPLAPRWYKLEEEKGELMLAIWFGTQADEVFPDACHSDSAAVSGDSITNTRSKVYLSPTLSYLRVNIIEAHDLVFPIGKEGISEVYVEATLGNVKLRTTVSIDKSSSPKWNEDLMFVASEPFYDPLILTVKGKDKDKDELISLGSCMIDLSKVIKRWLPESVRAEWYDLGAEEVSQVTEELNFASKLNARISLDTGYHVFDESVDCSSDYRATDKGLWTPAIGVLEMGIIGASGLVAMKSRDGRRTTDAYCVAKYGPKWVRTRTIVDSFCPKWNEQYTWEIYDPFTVLVIGIFDNCHLNGEKGIRPRDPSIGKIRIRLSTLSTNRIYTYSYPLVCMQPSGVKKMGEIQLAVRFTCPSWLFSAYARPLYPNMHYILPLSAYQIDSLRQQAVGSLSFWLGRADPPLRKEVVECMLDAGHRRQWSHRRAKANTQRLTDAIHVLLEACKWYDKLKKWSNPLATGLFLVLYSILLVCPDLILPALLMYCFLIGISQYMKRPRDPTHVDIKLSLADKVNADEWDEEFDTFPSSKQGDVLRMRYDKLRSMAGKFMVMGGDLATQGEKLMSLWTWEDPIASAIFLAYCVIFAAIVWFGATILKVILFCVGLFVMRPSIWRYDVPCVPQNVFTRLPSKTDSML